MGLKCKVPKGTYTFFGTVFTAHEGSEVDIGEEAAVGTDVLLVPPVLLVQRERPLPHFGIGIAYCRPDT